MSALSEQQYYFEGNKQKIYQEVCYRKSVHTILVSIQSSDYSSEKVFWDSLRHIMNFVSLTT